ncbi:hypothetical protein [Conchiformibius steedae]|uniref:hypothetical protein n=1 Tax=Conchiformibius steedae TaxID=153493 RepID=UPI0026EB7A21|nr:hypothetical protein [Conchiformibius steedae]
MNYKIMVLLSASVVVLSGCAARSVLIEQDTAYNPKQEARIRVYQINGNSTTKVLSETSCRDKQQISRNPLHRDNVHSGLPQRTLQNVSIGMPLTERGAKALLRNSYFQTDSFLEQKVKAGKPVFIRGSQYDNYICQIRAEFVPEAGKDYEVSFLQAGSKEMGEYCRMMIHELMPVTNSTNNRVQAKIGKEVRYQKCY